MSKSTNSALSRAIVEQLNKLDLAVGEYGCDCHNAVYNTDAVYTNPERAEKDLEEVGVFHAIRLVQKYEHFNFGEHYTKVEPCTIANMVGYIAGEVLLGRSDTLASRWDEPLTEDDIEAIKAELNVYLTNAPEDVLESAFIEWEIY